MGIEHGDIHFVSGIGNAPDPMSQEERLAVLEKRISEEERKLKEMEDVG